jgi:hypothetical protein
VPGVPEFSTTVAIRAYAMENAMPVPTLAHCSRIYNSLILIAFTADILVTAQFQVDGVVSVCDQTVM